MAREATPWERGRWRLPRVIGALTEGNSIRGTGRMFKVDKNAVLDFAMLIGAGCALLHNRLVRGLRTLIIEGDETWSFIYKKQSRLQPGDPPEYGDAYTFIGLDAIVKLIISYLVAKRDEESADIFAKDLRSRVTMVPHLSTDGFNAYPGLSQRTSGQRSTTGPRSRTTGRIAARTGLPLRAAARSLRDEARRARRSG